MKASFKVIMIGDILTIVIADAVSDALGIHDQAIVISVV